MSLGPNICIDSLLHLAKGGDEPLPVEVAARIYAGCLNYLERLGNHKNGIISVANIQARVFRHGSDAPIVEVTAELYGPPGIGKFLVSANRESLDGFAGKLFSMTWVSMRLHMATIAKGLSVLDEYERMNRPKAVA